MKTNAKIAFLAFFLLLLGATPAQSQNLPAVFMLGEDETAYEKICTEYPRTLLSVSDNDMDKALKNWFGLLGDMDQYAKSINMDIRGLRVWLHVFWKENGQIDHIGYFPMPDSRNLKTEDVRAFFTSFVRQYKPKMSSDRNFSHYTSASFPVLTEKK